MKVVVSITPRGAGFQERQITRLATLGAKALH